MHDDVRACRDRGTAALLVVRADERDAREAGLSRADRLGEEHVGQRPHDRLLDRGREQRGGGVERHKRGRVVAAGGQRLHQRPGHRVADDGKHVDLVPLHRFPDRVRVELRQDHGGVPAEQARQRGHHGGAVDERGRRHADHAVAPGPRAGLRPLVLERLAGDEVDAAAERAPEVLMAPHDALRLPGGATGVDDVDVIGAARAEVAGTGLGRECRSVVPADHDARQPGGRDGIDDRRQVLVVDEDGQARVVQVVRQLLRQVPVVDVDHYGPELDRGEQRRHGLDGVAGVQADVAAGTDALGGQVMREPVGLVLEPGVGDLAVAADQRDTLREGIHGMLEQVGHVQRHG